MSTARFYSDLKTHHLPYAALLQQEHFCSPPEDWTIVVSDIKNSTAAIQRGAHNDINLVAAGSLVATLNIARSKDLEIPFFFGGDGSTFMVPPDILSEVMVALRQHAESTEKNFGFSLHLGAVKLRKVLDAGHYVSLTKTTFGTGINKAVVVGKGLLWAERQIKGAPPPDEQAAAGTEHPDMMGLECRWDHVAAPKQRQEIVCYLIEAMKPEQQLEVYRSVLIKTDEIFGSTELRNPISRHRLKLLLSTTRLRKEMMARFGRWKWGYYVRQMIHTAAAQFALNNKSNVGSFNAAAYVEEVISNADTLTIDGRINMILSGTSKQRTDFLQYLDAQEQAGLLVYGHHINRQSVMTCYIQSREKDHMHFVDGSDGGYTAAASVLKLKLRAHNLVQ